METPDYVLRPADHNLCQIKLSNPCYSKILAFCFAGFHSVSSVAILGLYAHFLKSNSPPSLSADDGKLLGDAGACSSCTVLTFLLKSFYTLILSFSICLFSKIHVLFLYQDSSSSFIHCLFWHRVYPHLHVSSVSPSRSTRLSRVSHGKPITYPPFGDSANDEMFLLTLYKNSLCP